MRRKGWDRGEERLLIENYSTKTIYELEQMLCRNQDSINSKIKRLKAEGKLDGNKTEEALTRSLQQRRK
jgi:hypothetical protein